MIKHTATCAALCWLAAVLTAPSVACAPAPAAPPVPQEAEAVSEAAAAAPTMAPLAAPVPAYAARLEVIPRSAWGAKPVRGVLIPHTLARLTVHHSAQRAPDVAGAPARIRGFQAFHQSKGFPDLAYHYVVDRAGNVYEGRDAGVKGSTFTNYNPAGHFLALLDGNFEAQEPTADQLEGLARLLAWASTHYGIPTTTITGHKDHAATACPGKSVYAKVQDGSLKRRVDALVSTGGVERVLLGDAEGAARVKAIARSEWPPPSPSP